MNFEQIKTYLEQNVWVFYTAILVLAVIILLIAVIFSRKRSKRRKKMQQVKEDLKREKEKLEQSIVLERERQIEMSRQKSEQKEREVAASAPVEEAKEIPVQEKLAEVQEKPEEEPAQEKVAEPENLKENTIAFAETPEIVAAEKKPAVKERVKTPKKDENLPIIVEVKKENKRVVKGKYEITYDGTFYRYVLKASNGGILVESELYESKDAVYAAINTVKKNVEVGAITIFKDKRSLYQFKLVAKNRRVLVVSANYAAEKDAVRASESFKRFALNSEIIEVEEVVSHMDLVDITDVQPKKGGKIIIIEEKNDFRFQLKANNGEVLCSSELYKSKNGAVAGIETLKSAVLEGKFYVIQDKRGYSQFKLYSNSNRVIAIGESYQNKQQAISSARSVVAFMKLLEQTAVLN